MLGVVVRTSYWRVPRDPGMWEREGLRTQEETEAGQTSITQAFCKC